MLNERLFYEIYLEKNFKWKRTFIYSCINFKFYRVTTSSTIVCTKMTNMREFQNMLSFAHVFFSWYNVNLKGHCKKTIFLVKLNMIKCLDKCSFTQYLAYLYFQKQDVFVLMFILNLLDSARWIKWRRTILKTIYTQWRDKI